MQNENFKLNIRLENDTKLVKYYSMFWTFNGKKMKWNMIKSTKYWMGNTQTHNDEFIWSTRWIFGFELQRFERLIHSIHNDISSVRIYIFFSYYSQQLNRIVFTPIRWFSFPSNGLTSGTIFFLYKIIGNSSIGINNRLQHHSHKVHNHINYTIVDLCYLLLTQFDSATFILFAYTRFEKKMKNFIWIVPLIFSWLKSRSSARLLSILSTKNEWQTVCLFSSIIKRERKKHECDLFNSSKKGATNGN